MFKRFLVYIFTPIHSPFPLPRITILSLKPKKFDSCNGGKERLTANIVKNEGKNFGFPILCYWAAPRLEVQYCLEQRFNSFKTKN